jgi:hypothetical protein
VHFVHNLIPSHLHLANNKTIKQLVHIQGLRDRKLALVLKFFLDLDELLPLFILFGICHAFQGLEEWFQLLPRITTTSKAFPMS